MSKDVTIEEPDELGQVTMGLDDGDLDIPDLNDANRDFRAIAQERPEDEVDEALGLSEEEIDEEVEEALAPVAEPRRAVTDNSLWARNRILKHEKDEREEKIETLTQELSSLRAAFSELVEEAKKANQPLQEEEEEYNDDPLAPLAKKIEKQEEMLAKLLEKGEQEKVAKTNTQALGEVNTKLAKQYSEDPVFGAAVKHIAVIFDNSLKRKYPKHTEQQRRAIAAQSIDQMKLEWIKNGQDPVQAMAELAMDYNFKPEEWVESAPEPTAPKQKARDAREIVRSRKTKTEGVTSIGGGEGSAPKRVTPKLWKQFDEDKFNYAVEKMVESGTMRATRSMGKTPSFSDLLPGKGIPDR